MIGEPCIIGGDFNGHNQCWGSPRDEVGQQILQAIGDSNLVILNTGETTRLTAPDIRKPVVDITFCSSDIALKTSWEVTNDTLGSDHKAILITIDEEHYSTIHLKTKWNIKLAKWEVYKDIAGTLFDSEPLSF
nr:unnamed protein product [Callosobruchus chinensis]